ncbi:unnamed protein product [Vitrella brassicaformis CCMP3155]|uniref:Uncharacterized protein n=1 Tax=Vitrella brassicaformis (strain CCMP3155) TaxID=1169540 RepID=A0A0G4GIH3_VITBC|nr:unnamed protein product [Vitrella brassicaformis CCMP3155]|eukprot:CEM29384.1 unnamed protein product [Vitrella brassicaformis CCMP3155]
MPPTREEDHHGQASKTEEGEREEKANTAAPMPPAAPELPELSSQHQQQSGEGDEPASREEETTASTREEEKKDEREEEKDEREEKDKREDADVAVAVDESVPRPAEEAPHDSLHEEGVSAAPDCDQEMSSGLSIADVINEAAQPTPAAAPSAPQSPSPAPHYTLVHSGQAADCLHQRDSISFAHIQEGSRSLLCVRKTTATIRQRTEPPQLYLLSHHHATRTRRPTDQLPDADPSAANGKGIIPPILWPVVKEALGGEYGRVQGLFRKGGPAYCLYLTSSEGRQGGHAAGGQLAVIDAIDPPTRHQRQGGFVCLRVLAFPPGAASVLPLLAARKVTHIDGKEVGTMAGIEMASGSEIDKIMREELGLDEEERQLARVLGTIDLLDKAIHGMHNVAIFSVEEAQRRVEEAVAAAVAAGMSPADAISPVQLAEELPRPSTFVSTDDESSNILVGFQHVVFDLVGGGQRTRKLVVAVPTRIDAAGKERGNIVTGGCKPSASPMEQAVLNDLSHARRERGGAAYNPQTAYVDQLSPPGQAPPSVGQWAQRNLDYPGWQPSDDYWSMGATALSMLSVSSGCTAHDLKPPFFIMKDVMEAYQKDGDEKGGEWTPGKWHMRAMDLAGLVADEDRAAQRQIEDAIGGGQGEDEEEEEDEPDAGEEVGEGQGEGEEEGEEDVEPRPDELVESAVNRNLSRFHQVTDDVRKAVFGQLRAAPSPTSDTQQPSANLQPTPAERAAVEALHRKQGDRLTLDIAAKTILAETIMSVNPYERTVAMAERAVRMLVLLVELWAGVVYPVHDGLP